MQKEIQEAETLCKEKARNPTASSKWNLGRSKARWKKVEDIRLDESVEVKIVEAGADLIRRDGGIIA